MSDKDLMMIADLEIEALDDEALEGIAGGKKSASSGGENCCSCDHCSKPAPK